MQALYLSLRAWPIRTNRPRPHDNVYFEFFDFTYYFLEIDLIEIFFLNNSLNCASLTHKTGPIEHLQL
jgi:hypothetical protein